MKMHVFQAQDYKSVMKIALEKKKKSGPHFTLSELSEACQIQKTYLSRVLNRDGHLNSDQVHLAGKFLGLKANEQRYFTLLHEAERSHLTERKEVLLAEAKKIQAKALHSENYLSVEMSKPKAIDRMKYHLNPNLQLVHLFLTLPIYEKNPKLVAKKLNFTANELEDYLNQLVEMKLIEKQGSAYCVTQESVHLSADSELYPFYKTLVRVKALEKIQKSKNKKNYDFSVIFSANEETRRVIQERFLNFLKSIEPLVKKAKAEEVYQLNFDLLNWTAE